MKKLILIAVVLFSISQNFYAQSKKGSDSEKPTMIYTLSPFDLVINTFKPALEIQSPDKKHSIKVSPGIHLQKNDNSKRSGFIGELQYRNYLNQKQFTENPKRAKLYFAAYYQYSNLNKENTSFTTDESKVSANEFGNLLGYQLTFSEKLVVDFNFGGAVRFSNMDDESKFDNFEKNTFLGRAYTGVKPNVNLTVGIVL